MYTHPPKTKPLCRESVYCYRLADEVVWAFLKSYARAANFIARKSGLTPKEFKNALIKTFMFKNRSWNIVRDVIKRVENQGLYVDISPLSVVDARKYLTVVRVMVEEEWLDGEIEKSAIDSWKKKDETLVVRGDKAET